MRHGKFRRRAETAETRVVALREAAADERINLRRKVCLRRIPAEPRARRLDVTPRQRFQLLPAVFPCRKRFAQRLEQLARREISGKKKRQPSGRQQRQQRPAGRLTLRASRGQTRRVDIRPHVSVDGDADEPPRQQRRQLRACAHFLPLPRAPPARRKPDHQKYGLAFPPRRFKRFVSPVAPDHLRRLRIPFKKSHTLSSVPFFTENSFSLPAARYAFLSCAFPRLPL